MTAGEPVIGALHGPNRHFYCGHCTSWVFTRPHGLDWLVNFRATMLDDHAQNLIEGFAREGARPAWAPWLTSPTCLDHP